MSIVTESEPEISRLLFVDISLCGENGVIESHADETLHVTVTRGKLLAYGSARPKTEEFHTGTYTTYYGRSLAAIWVESDTVEIHVNGETMQAEWKNR